MKTTRETLAGQPGVRARCTPCGATFHAVTHSTRPAVEHRCGTTVAGPVWTLIETPPPDARPRRATRLLADAARAQTDAA